MKGNDGIVYNLVLKSRASSALYAAFAIEEDEFAKRHALTALQFVVVIKSAGVLAMTDGQILQRTFAPFVADWTIQGMAG
jgi:hypothetical protein